MSDGQRGILHGITEGGLAGKHDLPPDSPTLVGPSTDDQRNVIRPPLIPIACWRVDDIRFKFDSSFVNPEIKTELQPQLGLSSVLGSDLTSLIKEHPNAPLSVFGHADPVGSDDYNKTLSGRRAQAIYAMLVRDTALWEQLFSSPFGNDKWGHDALQTMQDEVSSGTASAGQEENQQSQDQAGDEPSIASTTTQSGSVDSVADDPAARKELFEKYMDKLCGPGLKLKKTDFLAHGDDRDGKGDYQGCGEFNPLLIFSQKKNAEFEQAKDKTERNDANAPNRRVMVLLFRKGSQVLPAKWPCPRAKEGVAGCKKRFFSDGENRRSERLPDTLRKFSEKRDTFSCRFYQRLISGSPCEVPVVRRSFRYCLEIKDKVPWPDEAILQIVSEDSSRRQIFRVGSTRDVARSKIFIVNVEEGLRYRGEILMSQLTLRLFGPSDLFRIENPADPLNILTLAEVPPEQAEIAAVADLTPLPRDARDDDIDIAVVENAILPQGFSPIRFQ